MNKAQSYIYIAVIVVALFGVAVVLAERRGKGPNEEPTPSIKPVAIVDTSIAPPSVPEGSLLSATDANGWGSYTNTRYGITFRNLREEGHHVVTDEANLFTYDEQAHGMIIGLEEGMNPSAMVIAGGGELFVCDVNKSEYAKLSFQDVLELTTVLNGLSEDIRGRRSEIVPITIGTHAGYGFVTKDSYSECENTYVNKNNMAGAEIVYLFFETKNGSFINISYPRNSRMAQTIVSSLRFIE